jgi:hypothetical protein
MLTEFIINFTFIFFIFATIYIILEYIKVVDNNENSSLYGINVNEDLYQLISNNIVNPDDTKSNEEMTNYGTILSGDNMKILNNRCYYIMGNIINEIPMDLCKKNIEIINENNKVFANADDNDYYVTFNNIVPNRKRY